MNARQRIRFLVLLLAFGAFAAANAQTGTVRGFVYDQKTGEPLVCSPVWLANTESFTSTDENGFFQIRLVQAGNYTLMCVDSGYAPYHRKISVAARQVLPQNAYLTPLPSVLNPQFPEERQATSVLVSVQKVTPEEIFKLPRIDNQSDWLQYCLCFPCGYHRSPVCNLHEMRFKFYGPVPLGATRFSAEHLRLSGW